MNSQLTATQLGYSEARRVTRQASSTFYLAARLFPQPQRRHIMALYAFCRLADDGVDEARSVARAKQHLKHFQSVLDTRLYPKEESFWAAFFDTIDRYQIPQALPRELLAGISKDVGRVRIADEAALIAYAHQVAGVSGQICLSVLAKPGPELLQAADQLGIAMQITNICRDVLEDLQHDRIYLPQTLMKRHSFSEKTLKTATAVPEFRACLREMVNLAQQYYLAAAPGIERLPKRFYRPVMASAVLYQRTLQKIVEHDYDVFSTPVRLSKAEQVRLVGTRAKLIDIQSGSGRI